MIRLWGRSTSTNVQKVLWLCEELDLSVDQTIVGGPFGGLDTPEFFRMNPNRTIPVIECDGAIIWESHAILRFLANTHKDSGLYPEDPFERSYDDRWLDWHSNVFWPPIRTLFLDGWRDQQFDLTSQRATDLFNLVGKRVNLLEEGRATDAPTPGTVLRLSDIPLAVGLNRLLTVAPTFNFPPKLASWFARVTARPAFEVVREAEAELRN